MIYKKDDSIIQLMCSPCQKQYCLCLWIFWTRAESCSRMPINDCHKDYWGKEALAKNNDSNLVWSLLSSWNWRATRSPSCGEEVTGKTFEVGNLSEQGYERGVSPQCGWIEGSALTLGCIPYLLGTHFPQGSSKTLLILSSPRRFHFCSENGKE